MEARFGPKLNLTIVYCSSEHNNFPISELQRHTAGTNGWQSAQQCEYPVELGFRFDGEAQLDFLRILSHESKISSKLEVFIAEATDEDRQTMEFPPYDKAVFRRLGHIKFSTNDDKDYEARELKTVNVHRNVLYLKLLLRQCHANHINVFNQVGIVALTVHGQMVTPFPKPAGATEVDQSLELIMNAADQADEVPLDQMTPQKMMKKDNDDEYNTDSIRTNVSVEGMDALTAKKIKELTLHKARAVSEEDYDLAKALKGMIEQLREVGSKIRDLEVQKREAVEAEDYDTAKRLKMQIDSLRTEATRKPTQPVAAPVPPPQPPMHQPHAHPSPQQVEQPASEAASPVAEQPVQHQAPPVPHDEQPVGGGNNQQQMMEQESQHAAPPPPAQPTSYDERPAVAQTPASLDDMLKQGDTGGIVVTSKPGAASSKKAAAFDDPKMQPWEKALNAVVLKLSGSQPPADALAAPKLTEYKEYINVFGTYVTSCFFCKRWQLREAAINAIMSPEGFDTLTGLKGAPPVTVCTSLLNYLSSKSYGVQDTISQVFFATCDALKKIISQKTKPSAPLSQVASNVTNLLPDLMLKAGDSNQRIREHASAILMLMATSSIGPERVSHAALAEPETVGKRPVNHRVHAARISVTVSLIEKVGLSRKDSRTGLTVDGIMTRLCIPCLQHSHQDVREGVMDLIVQLHQVAGAAQVTPYLEGVKPAQRALIDELLTKKAGSGGLQAMQEQEMQSSSFSVQGDQKNAVLSAAREAKKVNAAAPPAKKSAAKAPPKPPAQDEGKTCQFCGKFDKRFNEGTFDIHYVRTCPMLCPCPLCGQVTEIATLQEHLVNECERRSLVKQCPICHEAVRAEELDAHVTANACIPYKPDKYSVCPLCHTKLPPGERGWLEHLTQAPGCANNPRRWDGGNGEEFE